MDAHEANISEERAKIANGEVHNARRLTANLHGLQRDGDRYAVWLTVLHEVARRATLAGVDAAKRPC
jgi:hypothetical protein